MTLHKAKFVWKLAKRDILEDKKVSLIVVVMLSFAFLNLVFFPAFISGLSHTFTEGLIEGQTGHIAIEVEDGRLDNADAIARKVSRLEGAVEVEKVLEARVTAEYDGESTSVLLKGSSAQDFEGYTSKMQSGSFLKKDSDEVVVGRFLTEDKSISSVDGIEVDRGRVLTLRGQNFSQESKVRGVIGTQGGLGGLSEQIYMNYNDAEEMLGAKNHADKIKIILENREDAESFKHQLQKLNTQGEIKTWREQSNLADAINATFAIVITVLSIVGLIVALAAIGVVIFINTSKRVREMGIVRAIGAKERRVIEIFVLEAFLFGLAGVVIGNALTLFIDSFLSTNPIISPVGTISTKINSNLLLTRSGWMVAASVVAGFVPAYLASKTEIVETIENR
jgi:putative ABC transport system permease protein